MCDGYVDQSWRKERRGSEWLGVALGVVVVGVRDAGGPNKSITLIMRLEGCHYRGLHPHPWATHASSSVKSIVFLSECPTHLINLFSFQRAIFLCQTPISEGMFCLWWHRTWGLLTFKRIRRASVQIVCCSLRWLCCVSLVRGNF